MTELPFRARYADGALEVPPGIAEFLELEDGDVAVATILLGSGDVMDDHEFRRKQRQRAARGPLADDAVEISVEPADDDE